jgi:hypothetical protein
MIQEFFGRGKHEDLAIDTRVEDLAESLPRTGKEHAHEVLADIMDFDGNPVDFFPMLDRVRFSKERRDKMDTQDGNALVLDEFGGQDAVQSA